MNSNSLFTALLLPIILLAFVGCGEKAQEPTPAPKLRKVAPPPKQEVPATPPESASEPAERRYVYDPAGRRDPFESLLELKKPVTVEVPLTPLQNYEVGQLRLIGMIIGKGEPRAMVVAPDGKSYILKKGVKVGKNDGTVTDITKDSVLVEERYLDFSGEVRKGIQKIMLPTREGVE
jgi:type IV pilus assembly protein PilP